ncbi:hypothetical protein RYH73_10990 [Olivibacter sp. CPCC 100613]|uniref:hypothetical protein n=1 Tax=Olivibacter sp. CPCC 100613 TaxID=3079931 RepID=UPI002FFCD257
MKPKRIVIYAQDVSNLTGKSIRQAQRLLKDIRFVLGKEIHQPVTVKEFADYMGIEVEEVEQGVGG